MIVKDLLEFCTVKGVSSVIAKMARCPEDGLADLEKRCKLVIEELKTVESCHVLDDVNFCFIAIETDKCATAPLVTLVHLNEWEKNNYDISKTTEYSWFWRQTLGASVDKNSFDVFGADVLLGGIIYHITYFDRFEDELSPIRKSVEEELTGGEVLQYQFYRAVCHKLCEKSRLEKMN